MCQLKGSACTTQLVRGTCCALLTCTGAAESSIEQGNQESCSRSAHAGRLTSHMGSFIARRCTRIHNMPIGLWCQGVGRQAACFALQQHVHSLWRKPLQTVDTKVAVSRQCVVPGLQTPNASGVVTPGELGCHWPREDDHVDHFQLGIAANLVAAGLPLPADPAAQYTIPPA